MTHAIEESWHRRLAHFNYKALPYICKAVTSLPELKGDHEGVCNGCAQGKNIKNPFSKRDNKAEGVLELIQMCVAQFSGYVYYVPEVPEVPENQKHQSKNPQIKFEGGKSWIFEIPTTPTYSPQPSASIPWIRISKLEV
jgi:hypothetical protein